MKGGAGWPAGRPKASAGHGPAADAPHAPPAAFLPSFSLMRRPVANGTGLLSACAMARPSAGLHAARGEDVRARGRTASGRRQHRRRQPIGCPAASEAASDAGRRAQHRVRLGRPRLALCLTWQSPHRCYEDMRAMNSPAAGRRANEAVAPSVLAAELPFCCATNHTSHCKVTIGVRAGAGVR